MTSTVSGTFTYVLTGNLCTIEINTGSDLTGTSNTGSNMTLSTLPAGCFSTSFERLCLVTVVDGGFYKYATALIATNGVVTFNIGQLATGTPSWVQDQLSTTFTSPGTKGLPHWFTMTYSVT